MDDIIDFLEKSLVGANMTDDINTATRITRAIIAFKSPIEMDIFTQEVKDWFVETECSVDNDKIKEVISNG